MELRGEITRWDRPSNVPLRLLKFFIDVPRAAVSCGIESRNGIPVTKGQECPAESIAAGADFNSG